MHAAEPGGAKACLVLFDTIGNQHVFQRRAFLRHFERAVAVCAFVGGVRVIEVVLFPLVRETHLFGNDQHAAWIERFADAPKQRQPVVGGNELQRVVHHDRAGVFDRHVAYVGVYPLDAAFFAVQRARAIEHRRRAVDTDDPAIRRIQLAQDRNRGCPQRAPQVVADGAGTRVPCSDQTADGNHCFVAPARSAGSCRETRPRPIRRTRSRRSDGADCGTPRHASVISWSS